MYIYIYRRTKIDVVGIGEVEGLSRVGVGHAGGSEEAAQVWAAGGSPVVAARLSNGKQKGLSCRLKPYIDR